jgi:hypothetical protein
MKVVSLNEVVKRILFDSFEIFQYPYYSLSTTYHDSHAIKVAPYRQL